MKRMFFTALTAFVFLTACNNDEKQLNDIIKEETEGSLELHGDSGKQGSFSVDGKSYSGKTSTQTFADGGFSILCETDNPYILLQLTVKDKGAAIGELKPVKGFMRMETGTAYVSVSGSSLGGLSFDSYSDGGGSITGNGKAVTIKELRLKNQEGKEVTLSAEIPY